MDVGQITYYNYNILKVQYSNILLDCHHSVKFCTSVNNVQNISVTVMREFLKFD